MRKFSKLKSFLAAGYPQKFVESVICNFENDNVESVEVDYIIPSGFFDIAKLVIIVEVHFFYKKWGFFKVIYVKVSWFDSK